jgi:hypothetical protein
VAVTAGQFVSVTHINAGLLVFTPAAHTHGTGYASFTFQVEDDGGTANGGINTDPTPRTMTVNVTAVNQAPQGTSNTVTTLENVAYVFQTADFGFSDPNDSPANNFLAVEITTLPTTGTLTDNGVAVTAGQFVSVTDINAGLLVFTPAAHTHGTGYASFTFQVEDDGGTVNGGVNLDPTPRTMTVNVTPAIVNPSSSVVPPVPVVEPASNNSNPLTPVTPVPIPPLQSPIVTLTSVTPERTAAAVDRPTTHGSRHASSATPPSTPPATPQKEDDGARARERPVDSLPTPVETPIVIAPAGPQIMVTPGSPEQTELKDIDALFIQLDAVARQLDSELSVVSLASDVIGGVLTTASTGYVIWLLRAGPLLASVLSSLPAWRTFDPLPVLDFWERKKRKKKEEQERMAKDKRHDTSPVQDDAGEETLETMIS